MDLDKEYSPSRCSHRVKTHRPDELVSMFVRAHIEETKRVSEKYKCRQDVRYGTSVREAVDIYYKNEEYNTPIFIYIHGGYWIALEKGSSAICVAPFVEEGYRVVIMDYDLCPDVSLGKIVEQMRQFLRFILNYAGETHAGKVSICGHSAGAFLIAMILQNECSDLLQANLIKNVFMISGIYDLRQLWQVEAANPGNILSLTKELAEKLSPILLPRTNYADKIQIHVISAQYDSQVFVNQSELYYKKLKREGLKVYRRIMPNYDHFTIIEELKSDKSSITKYIMSALK